MVTTNEPFKHRESAVKEIHVIWMTTGLGCDGDSVSITAATQPSIEDLVMEVSVDQLIADVHALKPDIKVIPTSCKTGAGLDEVAETLLTV